MLMKGRKATLVINSLHGASENLLCERKGLSVFVIGAWLLDRPASEFREGARPCRK